MKQSALGANAWPTDLLGRQLLFMHMSAHYRRMYSAQSVVDSAPPASRTPRTRSKTIRVYPKPSRAETDPGHGQASASRRHLDVGRPPRQPRQRRREEEKPATYFDKLNELVAVGRGAGRGVTRGARTSSQLLADALTPGAPHKPRVLRSEVPSRLRMSSAYCPPRVRPKSAQRTKIEVLGREVKKESAQTAWTKSNASPPVSSRDSAYNGGISSGGESRGPTPDQRNGVGKRKGVRSKNTKSAKKKSEQKRAHSAELKTRQKLDKRLKRKLLDEERAEISEQRVRADPWRSISRDDHGDEEDIYVDSCADEDSLIGDCTPGPDNRISTTDPSVEESVREEGEWGDGTGTVEDDEKEGEEEEVGEEVGGEEHFGEEADDFEEEVSDVEDEESDVEDEESDVEEEVNGVEEHKVSSEGDTSRDALQINSPIRTLTKLPKSTQTINQPVFSRKPSTVADAHWSSTSSPQMIDGSFRFSQSSSFESRSSTARNMPPKSVVEKSHYLSSTADSEHQKQHEDSTVRLSRNQNLAASNSTSNSEADRTFRGSGTDRTIHLEPHITVPFVITRETARSLDEPYIRLIHEITQDLCLRGVVTNKAIQAIIQEHIDANRGRLNDTRVQSEVDKLRLKLDVPKDGQSNSIHYGIADEYTPYKTRVFSTGLDNHRLTPLFSRPSGVWNYTAPHTPRLEQPTCDSYHPGSVCPSDSAGDDHHPATDSIDRVVRDRRQASSLAKFISDTNSHFQQSNKDLMEEETLHANRKFKDSNTSPCKIIDTRSNIESEVPFKSTQSQLSPEALISSLREVEISATYDSSNKIGHEKRGSPHIETYDKGQVDLSPISCLSVKSYEWLNRVSTLANSVPKRPVISTVSGAEDAFLDDEKDEIVLMKVEADKMPPCSVYSDYKEAGRPSQPYKEFNCVCKKEECCCNGSESARALQYLHKWASGKSTSGPQSDELDAKLKSNGPNIEVKVSELHDSHDNEPLPKYETRGCRCKNGTRGSRLSQCVDNDFKDTWLHTSGSPSTEWKEEKRVNLSSGINKSVVTILAPDKRFSSSDSQDGLRPAPRSKGKTSNAFQEKNADVHKTRAGVKGTAGSSKEGCVNPQNMSGKEHIDDAKVTQHSQVNTQCVPSARFQTGINSDIYEWNNNHEPNPYLS